MRFFCPLFLPALTLSVACASPLRVGTTGDYAPFTVWAEDAPHPHGDDVEAAKAFARHAGVELVWVRTSWPELMHDLEAGKFDLAWGGITVTPEREARADFSRSYARGGKQLVTRCADPLTEDALDDATFMVNPGGTNETFVRQRFPRARVLVESDNLAIFGRIARGEAQGMFTDSFEAALQTHEHAELCIGLGGQRFAPFDLAVLGRTDSPWIDRVNAWFATAPRDSSL